MRIGRLRERSKVKCQKAHALVAVLRAYGRHEPEYIAALQQRPECVVRSPRELSAAFGEECVQLQNIGPAYEPTSVEVKAGERN